MLKGANRAAIGSPVSIAVDVFSEDTSVDFVLTVDVLDARAAAADVQAGPVITLPLGTPGDDTVEGTKFADTLDGGAGNDSLTGGGGNDRLNGGADNDTLVGNVGDDQLYGDAGDDKLRGDAGNDLLDGGEGVDSAGYRFNLPSTELGVVFDASDVGKLDGDGNNLELLLADGLGGMDTLRDIESVAIAGTDFADSLTGSVNGDDIVGNGGDDTIIGGDSVLEIDVLRGDDGNDLIFGGAGRDSMLGGQGNDTLDGGAVLDLSNYSDGNFASWVGASTGVVLNSQTGVVQDGRGGNDKISNINFFFASDLNDIITGSTALIFEQFEAGAGDDVIDGGVISDTLNFDNSNRLSFENAAGAVTADLSIGLASGAAGNDVFTNINQLRGSNGSDDTLLGSDSTEFFEVFEGRRGDDLIDGRGGLDQVRYDNASGSVVVNLATGQSSDGDEKGDSGSDTLANIESVRASEFNDTLTGGNSANGTGERDGFESFAGGAGNDLIDGGMGYDRADYQNSEKAVVVTLGGAGVGSASDGTGGTDMLISIEGVRGSVFNDKLTGSNDVGEFESFEGREGNDTIDGNGGIDRLDYSFSRAGVTVDMVNGIAADGNGGSDSFSDIENVSGARDFADRITGSALANLLEGLGGNDSLSGGNGDDTLDGGEGNDSLTGGAGNDSYLVDAAGDKTVEATSGGGIDTVSATVNHTLAIEIDKLVLSGTSHINGAGNGLANTITGNSGNNSLAGGAGNDTLSAGAGNDSLDGSSGDDSMTGGSGNDTYFVDATGDQTVEASDAGIDTVNALVTWTLSGNLETLTLSGASAINGTGNALANTITGNTGNNSLNGGSGNDTINGGAGNDSLDGSTGNDSLVGSTGNDSYTVGSATDVIGETTTTVTEIDSVTASVAWTLGSNLEVLTLSGASAINGTGNTLANTITGNAGNNSLNGGSGNDTLSGGDGNDTLEGSTGNDSMTGGNGNDSYVVDASADKTVEATSGGIDTVTSSITWTLGTEIDKLVLSGTAAINGTGNTLANTITGNAGNNSLNGGSGNDTLSGGDGNDTLEGSTGNDSMTGGNGNDSYVVDASADKTVEATSGGIDTVTSSITWTLGTEIDKLVLSGTAAISGTGNTLANTITGNAGSNSLNGGSGNDTLTGGAGNDALNGGSNNDQFVLNSLVGSDTISDFVSATDKMVISQAGVSVGDGNTTISGGVLLNGPGGFASSAELVVISGNIAGAITTASAAAKIGSATSAYAVGRDVLFAVDNGTASALYLFTAGDANALVSSLELVLLATLTATPQLALADFLLT